MILSLRSFRRTGHTEYNRYMILMIQSVANATGRTSSREYDLYLVNRCLVPVEILQSKSLQVGERGPSAFLELNISLSILQVHGQLTVHIPLETKKAIRLIRFGLPCGGGHANNNIA
jgi:hypothetical protein